jgi:replication factor C large subunit
MDMWTEKHKPARLEEIAGQDSAVRESLGWIETWKPSDKALLLCGPPGTGKTLISEVMAKEKRLFLVQINASDKRNSEAIESSLSEVSKNRALFHSGKIILIDEVDGISSRNDRGGVQSIIKIIRGSMFPIMLTANDPYNPKLKSLKSYCKMVKLPKVNVRSIEKRMKEICESEGVEPNETVLKNLARWSSGDMRSAIGDLQTICEGRKEIKEKDLESLGYRERETKIFNVLPIIFSQET